MNCASACTRPRSISSSVGPSAASRAISSTIDAFELGERVAGRGGRGHLHEAGHLARVLRRRHVGRDPLFEDQPAIQARRLAVGEQVGRQIELGVAFGEHRRRQPGEVETRQLDAILEQEPHVAAAATAVGADRSTALAGVDLAEIPVDQRQRVVADRCRRRSRSRRSPGDSSGGRTRAPRRAAPPCRSAISPIVVQWYG